MAKKKKKKTPVAKKTPAKKSKSGNAAKNVRKKSSQRPVAKATKKTKSTKKTAKKKKATKKKVAKPQPSSTEQLVSSQLPAIAVRTPEVELNAQSIDREQIQSLAYSKWEQAGRPASDGVCFWEAAEREVRLKQSVGFANLFSNVPNSLSDELVECLSQNDAVRIERIVSCGNQSPAGFWFDQDCDEWVMVVQGAAKLRFDGEDELLDLAVGDHLLIRAHRRHRVEWTSQDEPTIWLAVHYNSTK